MPLLRMSTPALAAADHDAVPGRRRRDPVRRDHGAGRPVVEDPDGVPRPGDAGDGRDDVPDDLRVAALQLDADDLAATIEIPQADPGRRRSPRPARGPGSRRRSLPPSSRSGARRCSCGRRGRPLAPTSIAAGRRRIEVRDRQRSDDRPLPPAATVKPFPTTPARFRRARSAEACSAPHVSRLGRPSIVTGP